MNTQIEIFIIKASLVDPIQKIITQLGNFEFRDCDVKWLESRLEGYTKLACETLGLDINIPFQYCDKIMNDYTRNQYLSRFNILLSHFSSYLN